MKQMIADVHSELAVHEASKRDKPLEVLDALPSHPRIKSVADIMQPPAPRCVRFSDRRQIFVFEDNGDCRKSRWYLYAEKKRFESEAARDARRTRRLCYLLLLTLLLQDHLGTYYYPKRRCVNA